MKTTPIKKRLTFGDFIATVYEAVGKRKAKQVIRLAVNTRQVDFLSCRRYLVA